MSRASGTEREPVQLRDDEGVPGADGGERLVEPGAVAVGAGEPVIEIDAFLGDAEAEQDATLGGEILFVEAAPGVTNGFVHAASEGCMRRSRSSATPQQPWELANHGMRPSG
jgi:hypothetical protein